MAALPLSIPLPAGDPGQPRPDPIFRAWAQQHSRERRRHGAELAQITRHPELNPNADAVHQLRAWATRHAHQKHLHDSALAQIRPHAS